MKRSIWLRLGLAAGLAILLVLTLLGIILAAPDAPQAITFDLAPMPPQSIVPGMSATFTWTVTGGTPLRVEFEVLYPSGAVADSQTYPDSTGISVVRLYTVPFGAPTGLYTSTVRYFSVGSGTLQALGNFCVAERGNLRVFKFEDVNGNGVQDAGEGPVAGIEIQIRPVAGSLCPSEASSQFTGPDGYATWRDIAIGQYIVSEVLPACWRVTREPTNPVTVVAQMTTEVTFANQRLGALQALKFEDANGNNTQDVGEGAVQGVTITVRSPDGSIATKLTDANGRADWSGIPVGSYRITETLPIGWKNVSPLATTAPVNFCTTTGVVFANRRIGNLHVFKFADANGNGIRDTGENPVQGISIAARDPDGLVTTLVTDVGGRADWDNVPIGSYLVTETLPAGWRPILPLTASATVDFNATTDVTFANQQIGNLHVFKFEDVDGNGVRNGAEGPVQGVTITVRGPDGQDDAKATGADGRAEWDGLPIGSYLVTETVPAGWIAILPSSVTTIVSFNAITDVTFGNQLAPSSCIIGAKVDDLHVGLPGWTIHARPRDAQTPVLTAVTDGQGSFHFAGLTAGTWTVWEEMQPGWAPVTPDTFDVQLPPGPACVEVRFKNRQACAQDPYEPDNTPAQATLIQANGPPYKHTLEPPADLDWSTFDATAGGTYTITTDSLLGGTDTYLTLYAADGATLLAFNDDIAPGADKRSRIIWTAPTSGRYYVRVRDFLQTGARGCLAYDLVLSARYRTYLPIIIAPAPPPPPTATPTVTRTPTPTPTPIPSRPPLVIPGLSHPKGIGVDIGTQGRSGTHHLYVASRDTGVVYEVDPTTLPATVVRSIPVGLEPFGVAMNNTTRKVYVANFLGNSVSVIDAVAGAVIKTISLPILYGEPTYVAINEATNRIYVPLHKGGRLAVIRGDTDTLVATVEVGAGAWGVAVDPTYNRIFVSCRDDQPPRMWTVDGLTNTVLWDQLITPGGTPYALAVDAGLGQLYMSFAPAGENPRQVLVYRLPETAPSLLTAVLVGNGGSDGGGGVAANPLTHHVFVSNSALDTVTVFDGVTNMVLDWVPVGDDPQCVAVDPGLGYMWVGNRQSEDVSAIPDGY